MFESKILADTVSPDGIRLTTFQITFPRCILAEVNTHRMLSRNAASSRAIPTKRLIDMVKNIPFIPIFKLNQKGMQATEALQSSDLVKAIEFWDKARVEAIENCELLNSLNIHKQYINRFLEPWMFCTVIVTATDWDNFFKLRVHPDAEPSFQRIATMMKDSLENSVPKQSNEFPWNESTLFWHLPFIDVKTVFEHLPQDLNDLYNEIVAEINLKCPQFGYSRERFNSFLLADISAGRCCKVSYLNLDTEKVDLANDVRLAVQMSEMDPPHMSPFEHQAVPAKNTEMVYRLDQLEVRWDHISPFTSTQNIVPKFGEIGYCGPLKGWKQYRKFFKNENYVREDEK